MRGKNRICMLMAAALFCSYFSACDSGNKIIPDGFQTDIVRILYSPSASVNNSLMAILKEKGFLENNLPENIEVEWTALDSTSARRDALAIGQCDVTIMNMPSIVSAKAADLPIELLSNMAVSGAAYYSIDGRGFPLESIDANDKLAVTGSIGNTAHLAFQIACMELLGNSAAFDNHVIALPEGEVIAMISNTKDLSGVIANDRAIPWPESMQMQLDLTPYIQKYCISGAFVIGTTFAKDNPGFIDAFYTAAREAILFVKENPDESASILSTFWEEALSAEEIKPILIQYPPELEFSELGYDLLASFMYKSGLIIAPRILNPAKTY
jgi:ABC-type nitrate/sulfonate/bicarbonate transport system substrate-binding protein